MKRKNRPHRKQARQDVALRNLRFRLEINRTCVHGIYAERGRELYDDDRARMDREIQSLGGKRT